MTTTPGRRPRPRTEAPGSSNVRGFISRPRVMQPDTLSLGVMHRRPIEPPRTNTALSPGCRSRVQRGKLFVSLQVAGKLLKQTATMPHVKRTRNASVSYPPDFIPGGLSNCRGTRSHEHFVTFDSLERVAGRLTHVLGDEGDDANRTSYRWPARLRGSGGAHTSSNGGKSLSEREMEGRRFDQ